MHINNDVMMLFYGKRQVHVHCMCSSLSSVLVRLHNRRHVYNEMCAHYKIHLHPGHSPPVQRESSRKRWAWHLLSPPPTLPSGMPSAVPQTLDIN